MTALPSASTTLQQRKACWLQGQVPLFLYCSFSNICGHSYPVMLLNLYFCEEPASTLYVRSGFCVKCTVYIGVQNIHRMHIPTMSIQRTTWAKDYRCNHLPYYSTAYIEADVFLCVLIECVYVNYKKKQPFVWSGCCMRCVIIWRMKTLFIYDLPFITWYVLYALLHSVRLHMTM